MVAQNAQNTQLEKPQSKDENIFSLTAHTLQKKNKKTTTNRNSHSKKQKGIWMFSGCAP